MKYLIPLIVLLFWACSVTDTDDNSESARIQKAAKSEAFCMAMAANTSKSGCPHDLAACPTDSCKTACELKGCTRHAGMTHMDVKDKCDPKMAGMSGKGTCCGSK